MYWNTNAIEYVQDSCGWIVTLDVLKYVITSSITGINALNSNIRCIEIRGNAEEKNIRESWIVTLDVLK